MTLADVTNHFTPSNWKSKPIGLGLFPVSSFIATSTPRALDQPAAWERGATFFQTEATSPSNFSVAAGEKSITRDLDDFVAGLLTEKGYSHVPTIDVADFVVYYTALTENGVTLLAVVARDNRPFKACMALRPADGTCTQSTSAQVIYHAESRTAVPSPDFREGLRGLLGGIPPTGQRI